MTFALTLPGVKWQWHPDRQRSTTEALRVSTVTVGECFGKVGGWWELSKSFLRERQLERLRVLSACFQVQACCPESSVR